MNASLERIGVSTDSFYLWTPHTHWLEEQLTIIDLVRPIVSRVEIHLSIPDIFALRETMLLRYQEALRGFEVSLHLPQLSEMPNEIPRLLPALQTVMRELKIEYAVMHVDDFVRLKLAHIPFHSAIRFGVENSDINKFGFQHLKDLALFQHISAVIDIDHLEELKRGSTADELATLTNAIIGIHCSTPYNAFFARYPFGKETRHFLFTQSEAPIPKLPPDVPIIIEGVVPKNEIVFLEEEVALTKDRL